MKSTLKNLFVRLHTRARNASKFLFGRKEIRSTLVAVALANKMARTAWAMMKRGETYRRPSAAAGVVAA